LTYYKTYRLIAQKVQQLFQVLCLQKPPKAYFAAIYKRQRLLAPASAAAWRRQPALPYTFYATARTYRALL
jgi:hypothetical protein